MPTSVVRRATPPLGNNISTTDPSHYFGANPQVRVENLINAVDADNPTGPVVLIGNPLTWTYQVFNDGNVSLANLSVRDDNGTPSDPADDLQVCQISSLAAGATQTCTRSSQAVAGQHVNVSSVTGTPPVGGVISDTDPGHYYGARAGLSLIKRTNNQDANQPPGPYILVGGAVSWRYDLTNTGEVDLSGVSITDDNGTPAIPGDDYVCNLGTLSAGASQACVKNGVAQPGQYANTARAAGSYTGTEISTTDPSHYFGANPVIQLDQRVNLQETSSPPGIYILAGGTLTWSYQVTNAGNVTLTNVVVTDDNGTPGILTDDLTVCTIPSLSVGASQSCNRQEVASMGQHANQGRATGTPPGGLSAVSAQDMGYYFGASPGLSLEKKTNVVEADTAPGPYLLAGSTVSWTFDLVNIGNVALTGLTVTDDNGTPDDLTDDRLVCALDELAIGEAYSCALGGTAQAGQYGNLGRAMGTPPGGLAPVSATDMSHYFGAQPGISLTKTTQGLDADYPPGPAILAGESVVWDYAIHNIGNVDLTNIRVRDDNGTPANPLDDFNVCTLSSLVVGAAHTCTRNGTAEPGQYTNIGTAVGKPPGSIPDVSATDPSNYFGEAPSVHLVKATNGQDANTPPGPVVLVGNPVEWTYTVTNDGNVTLTDIIVTDDYGTPANLLDDITVCTIDSLPAGGSDDCSLPGIAETGQYANLGSVNAQAPQGPLLTASDPSHYYGAPPGIGLLIYTNGQAAIDPPGPYLLVGDSILWTYEVINTGEVDLFEVSVVDNLGTPSNSLDDQVVCTLDSLPAGETHTCTLAGVAASGQYANTAVASGTPQDGSRVTGSAVSHYFGIAPAIELEKQTNHLDADTAPGPYIPVGDPVTWLYMVTNSGNVTLQNITIQDNNGTPANPGDDLVVCTLTNLGPAASRTCSRTGVAIAGQYANLGTVTGSPPVGPTVQDSDTANYFGASSLLSLEKRTNGLDADSAPGPYVLAGTTVEWTYEVRNEGNVILSDITVVDDLGTPLDESDDITICNIPSLGVAETQLCSHSDTAQAGQYVNVAGASGTPPGGLPMVTVSDAAYYFGAAPQLDVQKLTNRQDADAPPGPYILVGDPAQWTYEVTNTGNVPLTNLTITDDMGTPGNPVDDWSCTHATLAVGATRSCEHSLPAVAGQYSNTASASGTPPGGLSAVTDQDASHYFGAAPAHPTREIDQPSGCRGSSWPRHSSG